MDNITGKDLLDIGYTQGKALGAALKVCDFLYETNSLGKDNVLNYMKNVIENPIMFLEDETVKPIVDCLIEPAKPFEITLNPGTCPYSIYGITEIEKGARDQMDISCKLPISISGALMPDAHQGYGLPIGGVLATNNAVIPFGVGVDIGCRMALSIFNLKLDSVYDNFIDQNEGRLINMIMNNTAFGSGQCVINPMDDAVLSSNLFKEIKVIKDLKDKAAAQIGSSGGGNHFVEFGAVEIDGEIYLGLLTHSGSRGFGATIANYYTDKAMQQTKLPKHAKHLAWLDLDTELGQEYWLAMNLAGDYASACHDHIHKRITKALGINTYMKIENHHNFAWKEKLNGQDVIVHRKGATPAGKGVLGIIPGSMTTAGYIVRGLGNEISINSASHGAGRLMSRTQGKAMISEEMMANDLLKNKVTLIGGGLDESSMVYKDIEKVMKHQTDLVEVIGKFTPRIVRMAE
jgi:tRNA-splicing ligase RtcB